MLPSVAARGVTSGRLLTGCLQMSADDRPEWLSKQPQAGPFRCLPAGCCSRLSAEWLQWQLPTTTASVLAVHNQSRDGQAAAATQPASQLTANVVALDMGPLHCTGMVAHGHIATAVALQLNSLPTLQYTVASATLLAVHRRR